MAPLMSPFLSLVSHIDAKQKQQVGMLRPKKTTTFYDRQPGEKSHWSGEAAGAWKPVAPTKVVEVRYDHFSDQRFRHGCTFLRVRQDKLPKDCLLEQVLQRTLIGDIKGVLGTLERRVRLSHRHRLITASCRLFLVNNRIVQWPQFAPRYRFRHCE
jgi:hypothetical protein